MGYNKKLVVLLTWFDKSSKKKNHNRDTDRLSVGLTEFMMMKAWFIKKIRRCCKLFSIEEKEVKKRDIWSHMLGYSLNIIDGFTDEY